MGIRQSMGWALDIAKHTYILEYFNIKNVPYLILPSGLSRYFQLLWLRFVVGSYECVKRLEGKIRDGIYFMLKYSKITIRWHHVWIDH